MLRIIVFVVFLISGINSVHALSMYRVNVAIPNNQQGSEQTAKETALQEVLVRASGQSSILQNPTIKKALPSVQRYINQIGFNQQQNQRILEVEFNPERIRALLAKINIPYWEEPRPEVLFWLVEDATSGRNIVWEQSNSPLIDALKTEAERRGLPALIPVGDFDDVVSIAIPDLWGGFAEQMHRASQRYLPRGVVLVRIHQGRSMDWQFYPDLMDMMNQTPIEENASGSLENQLTHLIDSLVDYYVSHEVVNLDKPTNSLQPFQVTGLHSTADFFALESLLKSLNSVGSVRLSSVAENTAFFELNLLASPDVFENELMKDRRLLKSNTVENWSIDSSTSPSEPEFIASNNVYAGAVPQATLEPVSPTSEIPSNESTQTPAIIYQWVGY